VVLFAKTKFARDKHGQTLAGLVDFGVKSATKTQLHSVLTRAHPWCSLFSGPVFPPPRRR
jgi:hypothetical protein